MSALQNSFVQKLLLLFGYLRFVPPGNRRKIVKPISTISFSAPEPIEAIFLTSEKWFVVSFPALLQTSFALLIIFPTFPHLLFPKSDCIFLALQPSTPSISATADWNCSNSYFIASVFIVLDF